MPEAEGLGALPKRILLATDLSGRGDRALDRATQLAASWGAELVVVHALEGDMSLAKELDGLPSWRQPPDPAALVERQILEDIRGAMPPLRIIVEEGAPSKVILDAVAREACDLVIVGLRRQRALGGIGATVGELFRRCPVSILVTKRRPNGPYRQVLVGTDFTEEARFGLEAAVRLFPEAAFALMHAYEMPYRSMLQDNQLSRDFSEMEKSTIGDFLAKADMPEDVRRKITTLVEHGAPEAMLSSYAIERGCDLTVIGAYERSRLFHYLVGGEGPRIVQAVPTDVLVVRAERPAE